MFQIYTIAFLSGLAVMGIELSASRLIAPYFGTSLFVWTNVIAVILGALSLGYYLGGKISEKASDLKNLLYIIFVAGIFLAIIPFITKSIASLFLFDFSFLTSASFIIMIGSFLLTVSLFFMPITLLGMVSPFLIKLVSLKRQDMGNVSGHIFAVSTIGSIVGTFLPAIIFIPLIGTKYTILVFASILILLGVFAFNRKSFFIAIPLLFVPFGGLDATIKDTPGLLTEDESPYQYLQAVQTDGNTRYLIYNEGGAWQSIYHIDSAFTGKEYFDVAALLPAINNGKKAMIIGLAGGAISRSMQELYGNDPEFKITGVEIDPDVIKIAKEYFNLSRPALEIKNADGRMALEFADEKYDSIFVDAYANQLYIPFHLATKEFFESASKRLNDNGILAINVNASSVDSEILRAITNTIASVFPNVYRIHAGQNWNYVIFASKSPIDFDNLKDIKLNNINFENFAHEIVDNIYSASFDSTEKILTDDWSPIEHMTDKMIWDYFWKSIKLEQ